MLGLEICRRLREQGRDVRGLVRIGSTREPLLRDLGVDVHHGDLRSPQTVGPACDGVTTVVSTATAMAEKERGLTLRAVDLTTQMPLGVFPSSAPRRGPPAIAFN